MVPNAQFARLGVGRGHVFGAPLALAGVGLSAAIAAAVVATANRRRWPTGVVGTAVTWTAWLGLAGLLALLVAYRTLR
jgi:hypothetical protein